MTSPFILPPKPFYLVRHGETVANAANLAAGGRLNTPLTVKGQEQAQALAQKMANLGIKTSHIYHSPLVRAVDTAHAINTTLQVGMTAHPDLIEHIFGDWEGVSWDAIHAQGGRDSVDPPNGETIAAFTHRVVTTIGTILNADDPAHPPILVAHGGLFRAIRLAYGQAPTPISNCEMHFFEPMAAHAAFPWKVSIIHQTP